MLLPQVRPTRRRRVTLSIVVAVVCVIASTSVSRATGTPTTGPANTPPATGPSKDKGMISGVVKNADDGIAADLEMRLIKDMPIGMRGEGGGGEKLIQRITTDKDGNYSFTNIKPGNYRIIAGSGKIGWIYYDLDVPAGEETKLDLKLTKVGGAGGQNDK